jgi:hypothetical protein
MQPLAHRARRPVHLAWDAVSGLAAALALFSYYQFHGIKEADPFFIVELSGAVVMFALSVWGALRAFKHHGKWNRRLALVTLAILLTTLLIATLLTSMTEPPRPQQIEYGEP